MPISRAEGWKIALSLPGSTETLWFHKPAVFIHDRFLTKVHAVSYTHLTLPTICSV